MSLNIVDTKTEISLRTRMTGKCSRAKSVLRILTNFRLSLLLEERSPSEGTHRDFFCGFVIIVGFLTQLVYATLKST